MHTVHHIWGRMLGRWFLSDVFHSLGGVADKRDIIGKVAIHVVHTYMCLNVGHSLFIHTGDEEDFTSRIFPYCQLEVI